MWWCRQGGTLAIREGEVVGKRQSLPGTGRYKNARKPLCPAASPRVVAHHLLQAAKVPKIWTSETGRGALGCSWTPHHFLLHRRAPAAIHPLTMSTPCALTNTTSHVFGLVLIAKTCQTRHKRKESISNEHDILVFPYLNIPNLVHVSTQIMRRYLSVWRSEKDC